MLLKKYNIQLRLDMNTLFSPSYKYILIHNYFSRITQSIIRTHTIVTITVCVRQLFTFLLATGRSVTLTVCVRQLFTVLLATGHSVTLTVCVRQLFTVLLATGRPVTLTVCVRQLFTFLLATGHSVTLTVCVRQLFTVLLATGRPVALTVSVMQLFTVLLATGRSVTVKEYVSQLFTVLLATWRYLCLVAIRIVPMFNARRQHLCRRALRFANWDIPLNLLNLPSPIALLVEQTIQWKQQINSGLEWNSYSCPMLIRNITSMIK